MRVFIVKNEATEKFFSKITGNLLKTMFVKTQVHCMASSICYVVALPNTENQLSIEGKA